MSKRLKTVLAHIHQHFKLNQNSGNESSFIKPEWKHTPSDNTNLTVLSENSDVSLYSQSPTKGKNGLSISHRQPLAFSSEALSDTPSTSTWMVKVLPCCEFHGSVCLGPSVSEPNWIWRHIKNFEAIRQTVMGRERGFCGYGSERLSSLMLVLLIYRTRQLQIISDFWNRWLFDLHS